MARKAKIQWNDTLRGELRREIKNYNQRIKAAEKRFPGVQMPGIVSYKAIYPLITSKSEYNRVINQLRRATASTLKPVKRGTGTIYERQELARDKKRQVRKQANAAPDPLTTKRMQQLQDADLSQRLGRLWNDRDFLVANIEKTPGENALKKLESWLGSNLSKSERWRENYIKALEEAEEYASRSGEDDLVEDYEELIQKIRTIDIIDFLIAQIRDANDIAIKFVYQGKYGSDYTTSLDLLEKWSEYG